jgi:eukaryotic-like serine/threonine-protein kinase
MTDQQQRYRVIERLASGGMAEVFVAESAGIEGFKKKVAIKRVLPHLSEKKRFIAMFLDEARLSAHLSHSNVVQVFDIGVGDNTYFIVMEFVNGADLKQVIKSVVDAGRSFPIEAALFICAKMCEGLAYAHECKGEDGNVLHVVHRDISPPNVLVSEHGEIKIVDFGLAKASTQLEKSEAGIIKGKFSYLAPEAAHGHEVDARADIFAVGIILWELLAGRRLFQGKSDYETVKQVQDAKVPPISQIHPEADAHLESILSRALAQDRDKRYGTARALGNDITRYLYKLGKPVSSFDIAELARGAMKKKSKKEGDGASIIGQLIQETLFQFTSLQDQKSASGEVPSSQQRPSAEPFSIGGLDDFAGWSNGGDKDKSDAARLLRNTLTAEAFEEGNLAALEDDEEPGSRRSFGSIPSDLPRSSAPPPSSSPVSEAMVSEHSLPPPSENQLVPAPAAKPAGGSTAVKALLLFVIAAGTAAAVWFSGLL